MPTVLIGGGTGLIGHHLSELLTQENYSVLHLSRTRDLDARFPAYQWDIDAHHIDEDAIEQADYIVNLAGAGVADSRWTDSRKKTIIDSRVNTTLLLRDYIEKNKSGIKAFVSASAIGYYGNRGEQIVVESDPPGDEGFLPESVTAWEQAIGEVAETGVRTVTIRIGVVLSTRGGALEKMLLPFKFYNGAYFGDGRQWMSWIHIDDLCRLFVDAIRQESMKGVYNGVAPHPERNKEFTEKIKEAVGKPAIILPAPAFALRAAMGEMADVVLDSTRVSSEKVESTGFKFKFPELLPALKDLLDREV